MEPETVPLESAGSRKLPVRGRTLFLKQTKEDGSCIPQDDGRVCRWSFARVELIGPFRPFETQ